MLFCLRTYVSNSWNKAWEQTNGHSSDKLGLAEHKTNMKETTFKKLSVCYMATDEVYTKHV